MERRRSRSPKRERSPRRSPRRNHRRRSSSSESRYKHERRHKHSSHRHHKKYQKSRSPSPPRYKFDSPPKTYLAYHKQIWDEYQTATNPEEFINKIQQVASTIPSSQANKIDRELYRKPSVWNHRSSTCRPFEQNSYFYWCQYMRNFYVGRRTCYFGLNKQ